MCTSAYLLYLHVYGIVHKKNVDPPPHCEISCMERFLLNIMLCHTKVTVNPTFLLVPSKLKFVMCYLIALCFDSPIFNM